MKEKTQNIAFYGVILFICCYFMRIMNLPNLLTVVCGAALSLLLLVQQKKLRIDVGICLLTLALAAHYVIANGARGILYAILYIPPMMYVLGSYSVCAAKNSREFEKKLLWLIFAMIAGYTILGILNSYMYYAGYGVEESTEYAKYQIDNLLTSINNALDNLYSENEKACDVKRTWMAKIPSAFYRFWRNRKAIQNRFHML